MYGRTDVRTDGHVTITSQPKFLGLIGYQTELNNALRMFLTSLLSSSLVPRAAIITVSATDRSSGSWNVRLSDVNELLNESVSC